MTHVPKAGCTSPQPPQPISQPGAAHRARGSHTPGGCISGCCRARARGHTGCCPPRPAPSWCPCTSPAAAGCPLRREPSTAGTGDSLGDSPSATPACPCAMGTEVSLGDSPECHPCPLQVPVLWGQGEPGGQPQCHLHPLHVLILWGWGQPPVPPLCVPMLWGQGQPPVPSPSPACPHSMGTRDSPQHHPDQRTDTPHSPHVPPMQSSIPLSPVPRIPPPRWCRAGCCRAGSCWAWLSPGSARARGRSPASPAPLRRTAPSTVDTAGGHHQGCAPHTWESALGGTRLQGEIRATCSA